jgi:hypothetical protein
LSLYRMDAVNRIMQTTLEGSFRVVSAQFIIF